MSIEDTDRELAEAKARLETFVASVTPERLLRRLEVERPAHPALLAYKFFVGVMAMCVVLTLAVLIAPVASEPWARVIALKEEQLGVPIPLLLLTQGLCSLGIGVSARYAAIVRGQQSPLLPDELKEHQAMAATVARLSTKHKIEERQAQR